jgi:hypothetical protein
MLFTIVMDYCGGTYVSQVEETSPIAALRVWATRLEVIDIWNFDEGTKQELLTEVHDDDTLQPVPLRGLVNAWYTSFSLKPGSASVNIVGTLPSTTIQPAI